MWAKTAVRESAVAEEARTPRWRQIESVVGRERGGLRGLRVVEVGSGYGTNAMLFAQRGANVSLLDESPAALAGGTELARRLGVPLESQLQVDVFNPPSACLGAFDVSCSFGLCEHFVGDARTKIIEAHVALLKPGGLAVIGVPNHLGLFYQVWMGWLKARGHWPFGTEIPFSAHELRARVVATGCEVVHIGYGSFVGSSIQYLLNPFLHNSGRGGMRVPQSSSPLDFMAYELLVIARKPR
jgi:SAM-dependent methyltransferase